MVIKMKEVEIEYKVLLNKDQFERIKKEIKFDHYVEQINYYFETDDLELASNKVTLRVRNIEDKYYLMIKESRDKVITDETILEITLNQFKYIQQHGKLFDSTIKKLVDKYNIKGLLTNQASLKTFRHYRHYKECVLFIDESHYYGMVDYELELESPSVELGREVVDELIETYNLIETDVIGKRKRAYNAKQSQ